LGPAAKRKQPQLSWVFTRVRLYDGGKQSVHQEDKEMYDQRKKLVTNRPRKAQLVHGCGPVGTSCGGSDASVNEWCRVSDIFYCQRSNRRWHYVIAPLGWE
jgi:hypothetical protein